MRYDPKTKTTTVFARDSHKSNGLMFDARGFLIACEGADSGGRGVDKSLYRIRLNATGYYIPPAGRAHARRRIVQIKPSIGRP